MKKKMNRLEKCLKYERECYKYLKNLFEEVNWKSKKDHKEHYDFLCYNNGLVFNIDAKRIQGNSIKISPYQINCALFVIKEQNKFILCNLRTLKEKLGYNIVITKIKSKGGKQNEHTKNS